MRSLIVILLALSVTSCSAIADPCEDAAKQDDDCSGEGEETRFCPNEEVPNVDRACFFLRETSFGTLWCCED